MTASDPYRALAFLGPELLEELRQAGEEVRLPANTELLRPGAYVRVLPLVLEGLVKVYTQPEDKELLLYYIQPRESCVMSFHAVLHQSPSAVLARTEQDTTALLLPAERVPEWLRQYPAFNRLFFDLYNQRYQDLLETIGQLLHGKLEHRLLTHLRRHAAVHGAAVHGMEQHGQGKGSKGAAQNPPPIQRSHRALAGELGTAREVVTRTLHKLEADGKLRLDSDGIHLLP